MWASVSQPQAKGAQRAGANCDQPGDGPVPGPGDGVLIIERDIDLIQQHMSCLVEIRRPELLAHSLG